MKTIIIYPGRFHPFGKHHFAVYEHLCSKFGKENVYIATSGIIKFPDSPFSFDLKRKIIEQYGINSNKIVKVKNPYKSDEITSKFDLNTTAVIFVYGKKDADRLAITKKDGSPGYFKFYQESSPLRPLNSNGYIYPVNTIDLRVQGVEMSGTTLREYIKKADQKQFEEIMGWFDMDIYTEMKAALTPEVHETINFFLNENEYMLLEGGAAGHMSHPFEDKNLTFGGIKTMISELLSGELKVVKNVSEKLDGQNLMITFKDGQVMAARNKSTIKDPMTIDQVKSKFEGRGDIYNAFSKTMENLEYGLSHLDSDKLQAIFQNGMNFVNLEILYPNTKNVIDYGNQFVIVFHNIEQFDSSGKKLGTVEASNEFIKNLVSDINSKTKMDMKISTGHTPEITKIPNFNKEAPKLISLVEKLQRDNQLSDSDTIGEYYEKFWRQFIEKLQVNLSSQERIILLNRWAHNDKSTKLTRNIFKTNLDYVKKLETTVVPKYNKKLNHTLEIIFLKLGTLVLKNLTKVLSVNPNKAIRNISSELESIINQAMSSNNQVELDKVKEQLRKLNSIGGKNAIVPTEGIVFTFNGQQYKLTGTFAPINQILGLYKFSR